MTIVSAKPRLFVYDESENYSWSCSKTRINSWSDIYTCSWSRTKNYARYYSYIKYGKNYKFCI
jgi:hypothetical protein